MKNIDISCYMVTLNLKSCHIMSCGNKKVTIWHYCFTIWYGYRKPSCSSVGFIYIHCFVLLYIILLHSVITVCINICCLMSFLSCVLWCFVIIYYVRSYYYTSWYSTCYVMLCISIILCSFLLICVVFVLFYIFL